MEAPSRPRTTLRIAALGATWVVWIGIAVLLLMLLGVAGHDLGWLWNTLAMAPPVAFTWLLLPRIKSRGPTTGIASAVVVALGIGLFTIAPPSLGRVERVSAELPLPPDALQLAVSAVPDEVCFERCSRVERVYAVPNASQAIADLETGLQHAGWRRVAGRWCHTQAFSVQTARVLPGWPSFPGQPDPPAGQEAISVTTTALC